MRITVKELSRLMDWIKDNGFGDDMQITIESTSNGIGSATEASVEIKKGEGIWIDLTDYDSW